MPTPKWEMMGFLQGRCLHFGRGVGSPSVKIHCSVIEVTKATYSLKDIWSCIIHGGVYLDNKGGFQRYFHILPNSIFNKMYHGS